MKPEHAELLKHEKVLPESQVIIVSDAGHHLYIDNPAETLKGLLDAFLKIEATIK
jgi:pimeloyl-ACP methyl ester carboxylesterase